MKDTAYLRVYENLREKIVRGVYAAGQKLPSKRQIALAEGVSVITAEHAYALLTEEGYLIARERSGTYVAYRAQESFSPPNTRGDAHRNGDAPAAFPPDTTLFPSSLYARAVRRVLSAREDLLYIRGEGRGLAVLRQALCRYLGRSRTIFCTPEQIVVGAGAEFLYGHIVKLLGRDLPYAIEDPSYAKIAAVYRAEGVTPESLPLGTDGVLSEALAASGAKVLHLSPYRSYPSGVAASPAKRQEYIAYARTRGAVLIEDDFASEFFPHRKPAETLFSLAGGEGVVYVNTFSRTLSPALRVGYMVLPLSLLPLYEEKLGTLSCPVPVPEQLVLTDLLDSGEFERHLNRQRRLLRAEKV